MSEWQTDDETRESIALAQKIAKMTILDEDETGDSLHVLNRLIRDAQAIFADKPDQDDA